MSPSWSPEPVCFVAVLPGNGRHNLNRGCMEGEEVPRGGLLPFCMLGDMDEQLQLPLDDVRPPSQPQKYRRKVTEPVRAVQLCWRNWSDVCDLLGNALKAENPDGAALAGQQWIDTCGEDSPYIRLYVRTAQNQRVLVRHGEWILPDKGEGRFYPVDPDIFEESYEVYSQP